MRARSVVVLALLTVAACAKPAAERGESSGGPNGLEGGIGNAEVPDPDHDHPAASVEVGDPTKSCRPTRLREVRYGGTVHRSVKLRPEIAGRSCVQDLATKIEAELACARDYNLAAWQGAYARAGLTLVEAPQSWVRIDEQLEVGKVYLHPENPDLQVLFLGEERDNCSGSSVLTPVGPGVALARGADGALVVALPKPDVDGRSYTRCSCFSGCGAMRETQQRFVELPAGETLAGTVELTYPAIAISTSAVESESCCCAP